MKNVRTHSNVSLCKLFSVASFIVVLCIDTTGIYAANALSIFDYKSTVSSDGGGFLDLKAELNYDNARLNAPIAVVMHGFSGSSGGFADVRSNAQSLRNAGFFVISVAMRGRDGSDGVRDSGGVEIYDIFDAVEKVKTSFPSLVNNTNISITGYSGGGGNTMSALTKFPDYFRAGSSYFGMSDYGFNNPNGWYFNGASASHQTQLRTDIGNPLTGGAAVQDRYQARASNLASKNNPYSEIHLFVNSNETTCPPINHTSFRNNAIAAASFAGEFDNINVHIGGTGQFQDFNGNQINETNEAQNWPHGFPTANQQFAAESWYLSRLLDGSIPQPSLNLQDNLYVAGFVKTKRFELWVGDGQNGAADLVYNLNGSEWSFDLDILSNNQLLKGILKVDTAALNGLEVAVSRNGQLLETIQGGGIYQYANFGDGDQITLSVIPEPSLLVLSGISLVGWVLIRKLRTQK